MIIVAHNLNLLNPNECLRNIVALLQVSGFLSCFLCLMCEVFIVQCVFSFTIMT